MLLTEKEAQEKFCPFARQQDGANRYGTVPLGFCIASRCMAWQWDRRFAWQELEATKGFCGLAGKGCSEI